MRGGNGVLSPAKQAELLKKDGNSYFKKDRIGAAIDAYTEVLFFNSNGIFSNGLALNFKKFCWVLVVLCVCSKKIDCGFGFDF